MIALPPSLSRSLMAGFSPATRTLGAGGFGAAVVGSCACATAAASKARAIMFAFPNTMRWTNSMVILFPLYWNGQTDVYELLVKTRCGAAKRCKGSRPTGFKMQTLKNWKWNEN